MGILYTVYIFIGPFCFRVFSFANTVTQHNSLSCTAPKTHHKVFSLSPCLSGLFFTLQDAKVTLTQKSSPCFLAQLTHLAQKDELFSEQSTPQSFYATAEHLLFSISCLHRPIYFSEMTSNTHSVTGQDVHLLKRGKHSEKEMQRGSKKKNKQRRKGHYLVLTSEMLWP